MPPIDVEKKLLGAMASRKVRGASIGDLLISAQNTKLPDEFREAARSMEQKMNRVLDIEGHDPHDRFQVDGTIQKKPLNEDALIKRVQTVVGCIRIEGAIGPETIVKVNQYLDQYDLRTRVSDLNQQNTKLAETCAPLTTKVAELEERLKMLSTPPVPVPSPVPPIFAPAPPDPSPPEPSPSETELSQMKRKLKNFIAVAEQPKQGWDIYLREPIEPRDIAKRIDALIKNVARIEAYSNAITSGREKPSKSEFSAEYSNVRKYVRSLGDKDGDGTLDSPDTWRTVIHGLLTRGSNSLDLALKNETGKDKSNLTPGSSEQKIWKDRAEGRSWTRFLSLPVRIFR